MEMISAIALSRLVAQSRALDVTAGNLANADTPGFRAERMAFTAWLAREPAGAEPPGGAPIAYVQDRATYRDAAEGARKVTGNPLDLAIGDAAGWFTVMTPRGPRLTRNGQFQLDATGTIVDAGGDALLDANGRPLQVAAGESGLRVTGDGTLLGAEGPIGRIGVVQPDDADALSAEGGSLFAAATPTAPVADPRIVQGAVEESNVQPIREVTRMMADLRAFQLTAQMIQAESDRESAAIERILPRAAQG